jgi:hypothetical protein
MQRPAVLFLVLTFFAADSVVAQNQWVNEPNSGSGTGQFSQPNVIESPGVAVPPPPAPAVETPAGRPVGTGPSGPVLGPPAASPYDAGRPGSLSVPPPPGSALEPWPMPQGMGPAPAEPGMTSSGMAPAGMPSPGLADANSRRLRTAEPPNPAEGDSPQHSAAPAGPGLVFRTCDVVRPDLIRGANYRLGEYARWSTSNSNLRSKHRGERSPHREWRCWDCGCAS